METIFLLSQEFKSPDVYLSILKGIALGHTKLGEISNFVGIEGRKLTRYLDVLQEIGLVIRQVPVTKDPQRFRKSIYYIEDNFLNFWFSFVFPNRSSIELRDTKDLLNNIMKKINLIFLFSILMQFSWAQNSLELNKWKITNPEKINLPAFSDIENINHSNKESP